MASAGNSPSHLYERDYYAWLDDQVRALREHRIEDVDWENVAEEIDGLSKSEKHVIESHLATIVEHLLKLVYARGIFRAYNAKGWRLTVKGARRQVLKRLNQSPSLRPQLAEMLLDAYEDGRIEALRDRRLNEQILPKTSPWTVEQIMNDSFLP